jgi:hypothetical protein
MTSPRHSAGAPADDDRLPPFTEQMAEQLGGWRGMVESSVPILVFVVVNIATSLRPALIASVGVAVAIGVWRLLQRKPVRHAINGLVGIGIGAFIAWRTGEARDFYLPGIIQSYAFAAALLISAAVRQPIVGWGYSVIMAGGKSDWRKDPLMLRTFTWLTVVWALVWIAKVSVQAWLYLDKQDDLLGIARLVLGMPPYVLLIALTVWVVRRVTRNRPPVALEG